MLKLLIGVVLLAHGIGHVLGLFPVFGYAPTSPLPKWTGESWLLPSAQPGLHHLVGGALWTLAFVGFILLAAIVFGWLAEAWWQPLAIAAAAASMLALAVFPAGFPSAVNLIGAAVVDLVVLVAAVWYEWVPSQLS